MEEIERTCGSCGVTHRGTREELLEFFGAAPKRYLHSLYAKCRPCHLKQTTEARARAKAKDPELFKKRQRAATAKWESREGGIEWRRAYDREYYKKHKKVKDTFI